MAKTKALILQSINTSQIKFFMAVVSFAVFTAVAAQVRIPLPFTPVPITLQTLVVVLAGFYLGHKGGSLSQLVYLSLGALGAPFFAGHGGALSLIGPKAGYLWGFVLSSFFAGQFALRFAAKKNFILNWAGAFIASLPPLFLGTLWLKQSLGLSFEQAVFMGFLPFMVGDLVKTTIAAVALTLKPKNFS